jgi:hypothetical protein
MAKRRDAGDKFQGHPQKEIASAIFFGERNLAGPAFPLLLLSWFFPASPN